MSRMNQNSSRNMQRAMDKSMNTIIDKSNQQAYDSFLEANPDMADSSDINKGMIKFGTALLGAKNIGRSFVNNAAALGYTPGGVFDRETFAKNTSTRKDLIAASSSLTSDYLKNTAEYGFASGKDVGALVGFEAQRGQIDLKDPQGMKERIQKTAKSIQGIRDIIKGPMSEVIKQLESTFGGAAMNTFGAGAAAGQMQNYRQFAEMTGTTVGSIAQYSRASGMISQQIAGHSLGAGSAGLTTAAFMAGGFGSKTIGGEMVNGKLVGGKTIGNLQGVDLNSLNQTMVQRVTGAQQSATSNKIGAALAALRGGEVSDEEIEAFKAKVKGFGGTLTSEAIAGMAGVSVDAIESGQYTRGARDEAAKDSTGTFAALNQTKNQAYSYRKQLLLDQGIKGKGYEKMSLRQLRAQLTKDYGGGKAGSAKAGAVMGQITEEYNVIASELGYKTSEEMTVAMDKVDKAQNMQERSEWAGKIATAFSVQSGGITGFLRDTGGGKSFEESIQNLMGVMSSGKQKEMFGAALGKKEVGEKLKAWVNEKGISETEKKARAEIVKKKMETLTSKINDSGELITPEQFNEDLAALEDPTKLEEDLEAEKGTMKYMLEEKAREKGDKQRGFSDLNYAEKQKTMTEYLAEKLKKSKRSLDVGRREDENDDAYLKRLQVFARDEDKDVKEGGKKMFSKEEQKAIQEGVPRDSSEWLEDILKMLKKVVDLM